MKDHRFQKVSKIKNVTLEIPSLSKAMKAKSCTSLLMEKPTLPKYCKMVAKKRK